MIRLNKFMADCGVASRRSCDKLITEGRVRVNRKLVTELGVSINEFNDTVTVDGKKIGSKPKPVYLMLHKPKGYVTTVSDDKGRKTIMELVESRHRLFPVGRLDYDTEGLIILTNDGDLTYKMTHPSHEVNKTYVVRVNGKVTEKQVEDLRKGVEIDGRRTAPAKVKIMESDEETTRLEVSIHEGRNRQIKKMFLVIGKEVTFLKRTAIGEIKLGGLTRGTWRFLNDKEINFIKSM